MLPKVLGYWYNSVSKFQFILPQCRCVKDKTTGIRRSNVVRNHKAYRYWAHSKYKKVSVYKARIERTLSKLNDIDEKVNN